MGYFHCVRAGTPTRFWINNPTPAETRRAIGAGAIACTTNPTFAAKVIAADPAGTAAAVDAAVHETPDDHAAADLVQRSLCRPLLEAFRPLHDRDPLRQGWVSVQGDPTAEDDPRDIVSSMRAARQLGPNVIAKIPVTVAGLEAIGTLAAEGVPIIATEIMAVSQAMAAVDTWSRAAARDRAGRLPPFSITHITGMVGLDRDVTINRAGTADELERRDGPVVDRGTDCEPRETVAKLRDLLPDFRRAWDEGGLAPAEFAEFGPVALFRGRFVDGWRKLLDIVRQRRGGKETDP